jgi:hypothetical protein
MERASSTAAPKRARWPRLVAREVGYADQAHLVREFHQFTGTTPTAFAAWALPADPDGQRQVNSVQDTLAVAS